MGYYTYLVVKVKVKASKVKEFKQAVKELKAKADKYYQHWFSYYYDINIDKDRNITFQDYERKFYYHEKFASWLAEYVEEGYIYCKGEDPEDIWCIYFDGKGKWHEREAIILYYDVNSSKSAIKKQLTEQINKIFS